MIIGYIKDSILNTPHKYIAHGVNCQGVMGSGVAKVLLDKYPEVRSKYLRSYERMERMMLESTEEMLGTVQFVDCRDKIVLNMFTQDRYGYDNKQYVSYEAIKDCFEGLTKYFSENNSEIVTIAIPKIGCGLAGGEWDVVEKIINEVTGDKLNIEVYYL